MLAVDESLFRVGPTPSFVWPPLKSEPSPPTAPRGIASVLHHEVIDLPLRAHYRRRCLHLATPQAVEEMSNIEFAIDSNGSQLVVHHIRVIRNGTARECAMRDCFRIIQPEQARRSLVYNGELLAILFLKDVRPGDLLDIASSTYDTNPTIPDQHFGIIPLSPLRETDIYQFVIRLPVSCETKLDTPDSLMALPSREVTEHTDGTTSHVYYQEKTPPVLPSLAHPAWYCPYPQLSWASKNTWKEVSARVHSMWDTYILTGLNDPLIHQTLDTIRADANDDHRCLADLAIRWVRDEIRYLALADGMGSYVPNSPSQVVERRYGDCKDKSVLLACLLRKLGWDACPALVHSSDAHKVKTRLPSLGAFDHAIVRLCKDDETYWIDPTNTGPGGLPIPGASLQFAYALPLHEGGHDLAKLPEATSRQNSIEVIEDIHYSKDKLTIDIETIARGSEADNLRASIENQQIEESLLKFVGSFYNNPRFSQPLIQQDESTTNEFRLVEQYEADTEIHTDSSGNEFLHVHASLLASRINQVPKQCNVSGPIAQIFPSVLKHTINVHQANPANIKERRRAFEGPAFRFDSLTKATGKTTRVHCEYIASRPHFDAANWDSHYRTTNAILDHLQYKVMVKKVPNRILFYATAITILIAVLILLGRASAASRQRARERQESSVIHSEHMKRDFKFSQAWNELSHPRFDKLARAYSRSCRHKYPSTAES